MLKSAPPRTDHTPGPLHPASALGAQGRRFRLLRMPGLTLIALVGVLALWLAVAVPAIGTVSAQTVGICGRTAEVQTVILAALPLGI